MQVTMKRRASQSDDDPKKNETGEKRAKKSVSFKHVQVFYFTRQQGFTCVPSQGGSTLGMANEHHDEETLDIDSWCEMRKKTHFHILLEQSAKGTLPAHLPTPVEGEDEEKILDNLEDYYFLQPVPTRQRRILLRDSGVKKVDSEEKDECKDIRESRERCGCSCPGGICLPETCECALEGIKCQVDRQTFPCNCIVESCSNQQGRIEFNPLRVRSHFIHTLMRLEIQKKSTNDSTQTTFNSNERGSCCDCQNLMLSNAMMKEVKNHQDSWNRAIVNNPQAVPQNQVPFKLEPISALLPPTQYWSRCGDSQQIVDNGREFTELMPASTENSESYPPDEGTEGGVVDNTPSSNFGEIIKKSIVETVSA